MDVGNIVSFYCRNLSNNIFIMDKVPYETTTFLNVMVTITECTRLKRKVVLVGSGDCCACSYCYDINRNTKMVTCKKKVKQ